MTYQLHMLTPIRSSGVEITAESLIDAFYTSSVEKNVVESLIEAFYTPERRKKRVGKSYRSSLYPRMKKKIRRKVL